MDIMAMDCVVCTYKVLSTLATVAEFGDCHFGDCRQCGQGLSARLVVSWLNRADTETTEQSGVWCDSNSAEQQFSLLRL